MDTQKIFDSLINDSDLLQGYVDIIVDRTCDLSDKKLKKLKKMVKEYKPDGPEEAGAQAIILTIINEDK